MKKENRLEKIKGHMPVIVTRNYLKGLDDEITRTEGQIDYFRYETNREKSKKEQWIKNYEQLEIIKNKEIERLTSEISSKNEILEAALKEKEEKSLENEKLSKKVAILQKSNQDIGQSKGGVVAANHKLKAELDAKEQVIKEYKILVDDLKNKNKLQEEKIQELSKKVNHKVIEYKNNGLPKQTKKTFSRKK